jgi:thiol-disulfide isomerase/thioredoxin
MKKEYIMKNKFRTLMVFLFVILLAGCGGKEEAEIVNEAENMENSGAVAEEPARQIIFTGQDIEGNEISSDIFSKSKLTMVNVWATYCNPCLSEMPELGELAGAYEEEEFQVIGIISDVMDTADQKTIDMAKELITQTEADYPHLVLNESVYFALLTDVAVVPTTFFIDENGVVLDTVLGAMNRSGWEEKINELLEKE